MAWEPISVRKAELKDAGALKDFENKTALIPRPESFFDSELVEGSATILMALRGGELAGYCDYREAPGEIQIIELLIHPRFRRQRIATQLFNVIVEEYISKYSIYLEVKRSNLPAVSFYESQGFKPIGLRKKFYPDGEDALLFMRGPGG